MGIAQGSTAFANEGKQAPFIHPDQCDSEVHMFSNILSLLRFITDPETRKTLAILSQTVSNNHKNWKDSIKNATAKLSGDDSFRASAFANYLLGELKNLGASNELVNRFQIVFTELVNNAFKHGCKHDKKCKVSIRCTYSQWFIRLEISDSGEGFHFNPDRQYVDEPHGLDVVQKLTYKFITNKKGNVITAFIAGHDSLNAIHNIERYKGQEILVINVTSRIEWHYMISDWEPLRRALEYATQRLILINCIEVPWSTEVSRKSKRTIKEFQDPQKFYALVVHYEIAGAFDLDTLNSDNFKVFEHYYDTTAAKQWLIQQGKRFGSTNKK